MLYFVEYVLLGNKGKNLINLQWIQLVDSLKEFNKYLWEKICYERTLIGLQKILDKRMSKFVEKKEEKGTAIYEAYAFQIWACEVISLLGIKYASHISRSFPKIFYWRGTASPKYT